MSVFSPSSADPVPAPEAVPRPGGGQTQTWCLAGPSAPALALPCTWLPPGLGLDSACSGPGPQRRSRLRCPGCYFYGAQQRGQGHCRGSRAAQQLRRSWEPARRLPVVCGEPSLQMGKLRLREVMSLGRGHVPLTLTACGQVWPSLLLVGATVGLRQGHHTFPSTAGLGCRLGAG